MSERIFTDSEVLQIIGYLMASVPEFQQIPMPSVAEHIQEAMEAIEDKREH